MEGSPEGPKSEASHNTVKMLTQVQAGPLMSVDVLSHPAVLGYTVSKSGRNRGPHLYVNGSFYADHDGLLAKFKSGELAKDIVRSRRRARACLVASCPSVVTEFFEGAPATH